MGQIADGSKITKTKPGAVLADSISIPTHVAIIMDGNGRWAEKRGLSRIEGHRPIQSLPGYCAISCIGLLQADDAELLGTALSVETHVNEP